MPAGLGSGLHDSLLSAYNRLNEPTSFTSEAAAQDAESADAGPIVGDNGQERKAMMAMEYPMTGIITDQASKKYLMDPSYWVWWERNGGNYPDGYPTRTGVTSPPAVWWSQRERWLDVWPQMASGKEGTAMRPFPRPPPKAKKKDWLFATDWWGWLDGHEKPKMPGMPRKIGEYPKIEDQKCDRLMPMPFYDPESKPHPGCGCPGPSCQYEDKGFFGGATPRQLNWINDNMMRRQTLPGLSDAISEKPDSLRHATVRLERNQMNGKDEPSTLDPRPPQPVENPLLPGLTPDNMPRIKPWEKPSLGKSAMKGASDVAAEGLMGGDITEMKAAFRLMKEDPDWLPNLIKEQRAAHMYKHGAKEEANKLMHETPEQQEVQKKRKKKRGMAGIVDDHPAEEWQPDKPQPFRELYEMKYRKFWPAMEELARRSGSQPARMVEEVGQDWRSGYVQPEKPRTANGLVNDIQELAGIDQRAARIALGGPKGRNQEDINAVDQVMPVPQPTRNQAFPKDRGHIPTPEAPEGVKAFLQTDAPPPSHVQKLSTGDTADMVVYPRKDGFGVHAKVPDEVVAAMNPEFTNPNDMMLQKRTEESCMDPILATAGAAAMASSRETLQACSREACREDQWSNSSRSRRGHIACFL